MKVKYPEYIEHLPLNNKKTTQFEKWTKGTNRHFAKKDTHESNKLMKRCSSLDIIITTIRYHFTKSYYQKDNNKC